MWRAGVRLGLGLLRNVDNLTRNVDADGIMGETGAEYEVWSMHGSC